MENFHHWAEAVDQCMISVSIVLEGLRSVLKQLEDRIRRIAVPEGFNEGIFCEIYPGLLGVVVQCIKDQLKVRSGS